MTEVVTAGLSEWLIGDGEVPELAVGDFLETMLTISEDSPPVTATGSVPAITALPDVDPRYPRTQAKCTGMVEHPKGARPGWSVLRCGAIQVLFHNGSSTLAPGTTVTVAGSLSIDPSMWRDVGLDSTPGTQFLVRQVLLVTSTRSREEVVEVRPVAATSEIRVGEQLRYGYVVTLEAASE